MLDVQTLQEILKRYRKLSKLTQENMAEHMGISRRQYVYLEKGEKQITLEHLDKFSELTGAPLSEIFQKYEEEKKIFHIHRDDGDEEEVDLMQEDL